MDVVSESSSLSDIISLCVVGTKLNINSIELVLAEAEPEPNTVFTILISFQPSRHNIENQGKEHHGSIEELQGSIGEVMR